MLKAFREIALPLPRIPEPEVLKSAALAVGRFAGLMGLAFALSRAAFVLVGPGCALAPFALALFAAALIAGINPVPPLLGCMLGAIGDSLETFNLALPIGCAVVLAGSLTWNAVAPVIGRLRAARRRGPRNQARSPNVREGQLCMALSGLGVLVPGLVFAGGALWPSVQVTAAALAALFSSPFILDAMKAMRRVKGFCGARAGLWVLALAAEAGACALCQPLALGLGALTVTLMPPVGALAGLGLGAAALSMTGDARLGIVLGLCGAASQLCERSGNAVRAGAVALSGLAASLFTGMPYAEIGAVCAGPVAALLLPAAAREAVVLHIKEPEVGCDPERLAAMLRADAVRRLNAMSAAFGDLAEGYLRPMTMPDEQALIGRLREGLCEGCPGYGDCWAGADNPGHGCCAS